MLQQQNEIVSNLNDLTMVRFFHSVLDPFKRSYFPHRHTAFELSLVCSGHGYYELNDRTYEFQAGDMFIFSTNEVHCITEIVGAEPLDIMNLQFEPRFIWMPGNDLFDYRYLDIFFHRAPDFSHQLLHDDPRAQPIRELLRGIEEEFREKRACYDLMVKNKLLTVLVYIRRNYSDYFESTARNAKKFTHVHEMDETLRYINQNLFNDLSLDELADQAHMSRTYFSTLFHDLNGMSPWEYIITKRISHAAHMLASSDKTILDVATSCGFNTAANFNYAFRKVTQKSPSQYRKEMKK